jgi:hypothetical protein
MANTKTPRNLDKKRAVWDLWVQDRFAILRDPSTTSPLEVDLAVGPIAQRLLGRVAAAAKRDLRSTWDGFAATVQDVYFAID